MEIINRQIADGQQQKNKQTTGDTKDIVAEIKRILGKE